MGKIQHTDQRDWLDGVLQISRYPDKTTAGKDVSVAHIARKSALSETETGLYTVERNRKLESP